MDTETQQQQQPASTTTKPERRTDYTLDVLTADRLDETIELLYLTFNSSNPLWRKFNLTKEVMYPYLRYRVTPSLATGTSSILLLDNKVVACQIVVDYMDYMEQRKSTSVEIPDAFKYHSLVIQDSLDQEFPRGTVLMNHFTAVHPDYQGHGFYPALNKYGYRVLKLGYNSFFTITTNPITQGKTQDYPGITNIRTVKFEDPEHPLFGVQMDLIKMTVAPAVPKIPS